MCVKSAGVFPKVFSSVFIFVIGPVEMWESRAFLARLFQLIQEGKYPGDINIIGAERRRQNISAFFQEVEKQTEGVSIGRDGLRTRSFMPVTTDSRRALVDTSPESDSQQTCAAVRAGWDAVRRESVGHRPGFGSRQTWSTPMMRTTVCYLRS